MSDLLALGATGVSAYRSALSVVGDNIVNAETPGYARRRVVLAESGVSAGTDPLRRSSVNPGGVQATGLERAWDDFKAADSRLSASVAGRSATRVRWLTAAEASLDDGSTGIGQSVTGVFTAADTLATDPGNSGSRRAFLTAVDGAAGAFRTTAEALSRTSDGIQAEARTTADAVTADVEALGKVNIALRRSGAGTAAHAQLSDERDRLLDNLSANIDITVATSDFGTVTVGLARGGLTLIDDKGLDPARLVVEQSTDGRLVLQVTLGTEAHAASTATGRMAGLIEAASIVSDRRDQLNTLAAGFAKTLNDWSAAGTDATGTPGTPGTPGVPGIPGTPGAPGTDLLSFDPLDAAATLAPAIAVRDPATVAAARTVTNPDGTTTVTANGNLLDLSAMRGTTGTEKGWASIVAGQSQILASAKSENKTAVTRQEAAFAARDDVAGIDLDREASDLLRFQQAYNGSAKIIQVARETLQTILEII